MDKLFTILVVDDDEDVNNLVISCLSRVADYMVISACSGAHAVDIIKQKPVDILLTDYNMPGMNGVELVKKSIDLQPEIRAMLLSGVGDIDLMIQALSLRMSGYIAKPFTKDELLLSIGRVVEEIKSNRKHQKTLQQLSLYHAALDQSSTSIMITDEKGNVVYVNPFFTELTGYSSEEMIGKNPRVLRSGEEKPLDFALWEHVSTEGEWRGEFNNKKKNGELYWESAMISPILNKENGLTNFIILKEDITEKKKLSFELEDYKNNLEKMVEKRAQELSSANQLLENEIKERKNIESLREQERANAMNQDKLASLGEIATGVAHEINQPLTYINTTLQLNLENCKSGTFNPEKSIKKLERALHQTKRITSIITHLRAFGRADDDEMIPVDLAKILDNSLILLNEKMRLRSIDLTKNIDENLPDIIGNSNKLEQIFINFFQNSIDALEETGGGNITVSIDGSEDGKEVILKFSDDGSGMPKEVREKIFDPFFTTKEIGKGTGLGMAIVFGIVQDHNGTISVDSEKGYGTTFTIKIPIGQS